MPTAFSYLRFSSPQQATGDSIRRQTEARQRWLTAHPDVVLDTTLKMTDAGRSAFKRKDWDQYALSAFLAAIQDGRVTKGSYLLVENLDRLSREHIQPALMLLLNLLQAGVRVVQLLPVEQVFTEKSDAMQIMMAVMELSRGNSESAMKSERSRAAWARKQSEAAQRLVTRKLPGWISAVDGDLALNEHAATVRRIFELARQGTGAPGIAQMLNAENAPVMGRRTVKGRATKWASGTVWHVLRSRAAIGEYTPYRKRGLTALPAVPGYFPPVVDADTFSAVQGAISTRSKIGRGRKSAHINLFAGLLRDWRDDGTLTYWKNGKHPAILIPVNAKEGRGTPWASFPAAVFDRAILSQLQELKFRDVRAANAVDAPDPVTTLNGRIADADALIAKWRAQMNNPAIVDVVAAKLGELTAQRGALIAEREAAERASAAPGAWEEMTRAAHLSATDATDETRTRLREAIRQCVTSLTCLFRRAGQDRLAIVRVDFVLGGCRTYVIWLQRAKANATTRTPGRWWCRSFAAAGFRMGGPIVTDTGNLPDGLRDRFRRHAQGESGDGTITTGEIG